MTRPIKDTPTLKGKDAKRFSADIKANEGRKVNEADYNKMMASYMKINNAKVK